jgi:FecR protein
MRLPRCTASAILFAAFFPALSFAADTTSKTAVPGTINYVEGQAFIGTQTLDAKSIGSVALQSGQSLDTQEGKVEFLLTPGVFVRLGGNSSVKMISPGLSDTEIELDHGQAMVEVAELHPENHILIDAGGATTRLLKTGLYDFDSSRSQLRVFDGQADVTQGDSHHTVKGGQQLALGNSFSSKAKKFDRKADDQDDLYRWSSLRSAYLAEENVDAAALYANTGWGPWGAGWWGAGWYWDPWYDGFTFIPGDGIFYSPFGWGFYSPWWVYQAPFYGYGGFGYGYGRGFYRHHFSTNDHNWGPGSHYVTSPHYANGTYRGSGSSGGFRSGAMTGGGHFGGGGFAGGGFHGGGGGGFHGGGGAGGHGR